jgi:hypothetical protein
MVIKSQGLGGNAGSNLRKSLLNSSKSIAALGKTVEEANFNYVK